MNEHILTIDDEAEILALLREVLMASRYRVTGVGTGPEALQVIANDPPDLIITDLHLEDMDGFELSEHMKAAAPDTPILLLTGMLFDPEVLRGPLGSRIAAYVDKTAPLERILGEVKRLLAGRKGK